jgi:cell division septal protein FtsQ
MQMLKADWVARFMTILTVFAILMMRITLSTTVYASSGMKIVTIEIKGNSHISTDELLGVLSVKNLTKVPADTLKEMLQNDIMALYRPA